MEIRDVRPGEHAAVGALTVAAYRALGDRRDRIYLAYEDVLRDVEARVRHGRVLVAVVDGALAGTVTYAPPGAEYSESDDPAAATIRMLAVAAEQQHHGIGEALVRHCIRLAEADRCASIVLRTRITMGAARRLYERLGFARDSRLDARPGPGIELLGFRLAVERGVPHEAG